MVYVSLPSVLHGGKLSQSGGSLTAHALKRHSDAQIGTDVMASKSTPLLINHDNQVELSNDEGVLPLSSDYKSERCLNLVDDDHIDIGETIVGYPLLDNTKDELVDERRKDALNLSLDDYSRVKNNEAMIKVLTVKKQLLKSDSRP